MRFALVLAATASLAAADPQLGPEIRLFNGESLDGLYTYVEGCGVNLDPKGVFRVEDGTIHVSGAEFGYFSTEKEYENYYLLAEFRWGEKTYPPREGLARDSGILFHASGVDKIWPRSIEFQMIEGGTGDIILVDDTAVTRDGETKRGGRFDRYGKGKWVDIAGYRDPGRELEKSRGEWNRLELYAEGDRIRFLVNGVLANEATGASVSKGKILFQSEGAELFFRRIELRPILGH